MQRLIYTDSNERLHAYRSYGRQKIPWDETSGFSVEREVREDDPTLKALYERHTDAFNEYLEEAIGKKVSALEIHERESASDLVKTLAGVKQARQPVAEALRAENRFWHVYKGTKHWVADPVDMAWALLPKDYIPEVPDLPSAETSVRSVIPNTKGRRTYWEFVCVLIALVKEEGYETVKEEIHTDEDIDTLDRAVQALHRYYINRDIQYDDDSTRRTVMNDWGYSLVFSGPVAWTDLHKHMTLKAGETYIVDIKGHTVKMEVRQDLPEATEEVPKDDLRGYYETFSEQDNFNKDEMAFPVLYVFKK